MTRRAIRRLTPSERVERRPVEYHIVEPALEHARVEYGTTTGRPRRCGWLDGVALRYAARVNGLTEIVITKLDVLSGLDPLHIATAYTLDGETLATLPPDTAVAERVAPVYETMPGWNADITGARRLEDLPDQARRYIDRIQQIAGVPATMISVGPERDQTIML